jgi:hypothetical protein
VASASNCLRGKDAVLNRQIESIEQAAHEQMKIGSKKADVSRFFAEQGIGVFFSKSVAVGALPSTGCAPPHCGDGVMIEVRVELSVVRLRG